MIWRLLTRVAAAVAVLLAGWVTWKWGGFDLMTMVRENGGAVEVANTFASVDHPFHATRGNTLLETLRDGELLRWFGDHHGGYPAEFYPLGVPAMDVALWALLLGTFPVIAVHKLTVLLVFLLPAVGFWLLARGDGLNPFVPVLALAIHVATPGLWTNGGMNELIVWGLVANVGGFTFAFIAFAALVRYVREGHRLHCLLAIGAASMALYANTRSGIAVATGAAAIVLVAVLDRLVFERDGRGVQLGAVVGRVALVGAVAALLTAPLLVSMLRYADYYYFVHYMEYADFRALWDQSLASVSRPLFAVAVAGLLVAVVIRRLVVLRVVAVAFILYVLLTIAFSWAGLDQKIIQQLETPRLMPFQRLVVVYLAAATIGIGLDLAARRLPRYRHALVAAALVVGSVVAIASYDGDYGEIPADHRMASSPTTGVAELAQFSAIVAEANEVVPQGSAIYVIGDQESWWHQQLWAPTWSDAPFYYDDWMWYWHEEVAEQCNTNAGHFTPNPARTLTEEWFRGHGIGALVVTDMTNPIDLCGGENPRAVAAGSPFLERQLTIGYWDLYLVRDAGALVTNGDIQPEAMTFDSGEITATFGDASGEIQVRHNWFPRWQAWADGERVDVMRADDDTMRIEVPEGTRVVELRYAVTGADWLARMLAVAGVGASLAIAVSPLARRATPRSPTVP